MAFRRLLKDGATGLYLDRKGGWSANEAEARDFSDSQEAIKAAVSMQKDSLHLVLKFSDPRMDVSHHHLASCDGASHSFNQKNGELKGGLRSRASLIQTLAFASALRQIRGGGLYGGVTAIREAGRWPASKR